MSAKVLSISSYKFPDQELEILRSCKLPGTQQILGLRLIEKGDSLEGRQIWRESTQVLGRSRKTTLGLILSYLPLSLRKWLSRGFVRFVQKTIQNACEKRLVRDVTNEPN